MRLSRRLSAALGLGLTVAATAPAVAGASAQSGVWDRVAGKLPSSGADIKPDRYRAFTLDEAALRSGLASAPKAGAGARARSSVVLSVPKPDGGFERFEVYEAPVMEAKLAAKHPDIRTWAGRGVDDRSATIRADITRLGFHASVRSSEGAYFVDPYYKRDDSVYVSYFTRDLADDERFVEQEVSELAPKVDAAAALLGPEVQLRTFRLALTTDPSYATYHGGGANVTAAKVTLVNRVTQIYEDESAIRMVLIGDNDKLNLDTVALANQANGPCGSAPCFPTSNTCGAVLDRNRYVIGQIIGASAYDIGHIAMGNAGGGVAGAGVGDNNKARGCTGLATPVGDYFAVDYVAHEMGHQFSAPHTFNGILGSCGGNRSGASSVEVGSGSSIMAYAGICGRDNIQPHSDPYWVPQSYHTILTWVTSDRAPISEVQTVSLRDFDGTDSVTLNYNGTPIGPFVRGTNYTAADIQATLSGNEVQRVNLTGYDTNGDSYTLTFRGATSHPIVRGQNNTAAGIANAIQGGNEQQQVTLTNFNPATQSFTISLGGNTSTAIGLGGAALSNANIQAAINAIAGFPGGATVANAGNGGFTVTFAGASAATDVSALSINITGTATAAVRENAKGGAKLATWPDGAALTVGTVTDSGYNLLLRGAPFTAVDADPFSVTNATGATGTVSETTKGARFEARRRRDRRRRRLLRRRVRRHRLRGPLRRHARALQPAAARPHRRRRDRLRGRDGQGRTGRQQGQHGHADRQLRAGRHRAGQLHDPAAHAVRADGLRDRPQRRPADLHVGAGRPRRHRRRHHRGHRAAVEHQDQRCALPPVRRRDGHPAGGLAEVPLAGPEPGDEQPDARVPGHGPDPGQQHQRGHGHLPGRAAGTGGRPDGGPRVLLRVPADDGLGRLPQRSHDDLPRDRA